MNFQFTNPWWLTLAPFCVAWVIWLTWKSDVHMSPWRRWLALFIRLVIVVLLILAVAGLQWKRPRRHERMLFVLDRSDGVPHPSKRLPANTSTKPRPKKSVDQAGVIVLEPTPASSSRSIRSSI